jgi:hypothetical protein
MGMDLTLCPHRHLGPWDHHLAYDRLALDRDYDLFAQISLEVMGSEGKGIKQVCKPQKLPPRMKFQWYDDEGLEETREDAHGEPLTYVEAGELAKVVPSKDTGSWNAAVFAMMKALPKDTPVVLWWH